MIKRVLGLSFVLMLSCTACAEESENCVTGEVWTVRRFQREFCGEDVWEPFNRTMFGIFDGLMTYAVDPFCYIYSSIIPKPLIKGIDNATENIEYPMHLLSNVGTADWRPAWDETRRFAVNSTVGVLGLFDVATDWFYIYDTQASFSRTFARWGIPSGPTLALPFVPRSDLCSCIGYGVDCVADPQFWIDIFFPTGIYIGWTWALVPNNAPVWRGTWESAFGGRQDKYSIYMPVIAAWDGMRNEMWSYNFKESVCADIVYTNEPPRLADVRPPVRAETQKPAGLKGRWRDIHGYRPRTPELDSLRALAFTPLGDDDFWWERRSIFNTDFSKSIDERTVSICEDAPEAGYAFVPALETEENAPTNTRLVVVMPGIGSNRDSSDAVAMAELLHHAGYAVIICDNIFHWRYVCAANEGILPGYLPDDVRRFAHFLDRVVDDLVADECVTQPEISVMGWSMGGLVMTHLTALEEREHVMKFPIRRYVAVNPPVDMIHAMTPFEMACDESRTWTREYAYKMFTDITGFLYAWASQDHPRYDPTNPPKDALGRDWDYAPNLTASQARYLVGASASVFLPELIAERHKIAPFPWITSELTWFHRRAFYDEIGTLTLRDYVTRYLMSCYPQRSVDEISHAAELRALEATLRNNEKLILLHTWNDPLLTESDRWYLDETMRSRVSWFAEGAHCGMFYTKPFADELLNRLSE